MNISLSWLQDRFLTFLGLLWANPQDISRTAMAKIFWPWLTLMRLVQAAAAVGYLWLRFGWPKVETTYPTQLKISLCFAWSKPLLRRSRMRPGCIAADVWVFKWEIDKISTQRPAGDITQTWSLYNETHWKNPWRPKLLSRLSPSASVPSSL